MGHPTTNCGIQPLLRECSLVIQDIKSAWCCLGIPHWLHLKYNKLVGVLVGTQSSPLLRAFHHLIVQPRCKALPSLLEILLSNQIESTLFQFAPQHYLYVLFVNFILSLIYLKHYSHEVQKQTINDSIE
jgi:hypothetical protein